MPTDSTTDQNPLLTNSTGMSAETGYESDESQVPFRVSGFLSLLFGLMSVVAYVALQLMFLPAIAAAFGLFALRRSDGGVPTGTLAAKIGLVLALGFGAYGLSVQLMKKQTLGNQAEYFSRQFIELVANDQLEYASELKKRRVNRFLSTMSLQEHYETNADAKSGIDEFRSNGLVTSIQKIGPDAKWELHQPTRVYHKYGRLESEVVLANHELENPTVIQFVLECHQDEETDVLDWHVQLFQVLRERLVAESIL